MRTSNVTKFLAASSALGVPPDDLFMRDDLIEATPDCLGRVAKNIVSLHQVYESPLVDRSRYIHGGGQVQRTPSSPYNHGPPHELLRLRLILAQHSAPHPRSAFLAHLAARG